MSKASGLSSSSLEILVLTVPDSAGFAAGGLISETVFKPVRKRFPMAIRLSLIR